MVSVPNVSDIVLTAEIGNRMKDDVLFLLLSARARFLIWPIILISSFLHVYYHF
jgi:hypothetical protein